MHEHIKKNIKEKEKNSNNNYNKWQRIVDTRSTKDRFVLGCDSESFFLATGDWANFFPAQRMSKQVI